MANNTAAEKREERRYGCRVLVDGGRKTCFAHTATTDISSHGVGFISEKEVPVNTQMAVEVFLTPRGQAFLILGQVKWVQPIVGENKYRIGLRLLDAPEDFREKIEKKFAHMA